MAASAPVVTSSELALPNTNEVQQLLTSRQELFQRHLAAWASDCLALRRRGMDEPVWNQACEDDFAYLADAA